MLHFVNKILLKSKQWLIFRVINDVQEWKARRRNDPTRGKLMAKHAANSSEGEVIIILIT